MQNFILYLPSISILVFCFLAYIIVIVPNVVSIFTAQPNEFLVQGVEQARWYIVSRKSSSARWGRVVVRWLLTNWESMYNVWFDQLLVTGQVSLCTSDGGATVCGTSGCLVIRSTCQFTKRELGVQHIWVLPWVGVQGNGPFTQC